MKYQNERYSKSSKSLELWHIRFSHFAFIHANKNKRHNVNFHWYPTKTRRKDSEILRNRKIPFISVISFKLRTLDLKKKTVKLAFTKQNVSKTWHNNPGPLDPQKNAASTIVTGSAQCERARRLMAPLVRAGASRHNKRRVRLSSVNGSSAIRAASALHAREPSAIPTRAARVA